MNNFRFLITNKLSKLSSLIVIHFPAVPFRIYLLAKLFRTSLPSRRLQIASNALHEVVYSVERLNWNLGKKIPNHSVKNMKAFLTLKSESSNGDLEMLWLLGCWLLGFISAILSAMAVGCRKNLLSYEPQSLIGTGLVFISKRRRDEHDNKNQNCTRFWKHFELNPKSKQFVDNQSCYSNFHSNLKSRTEKVNWTSMRKF